MEQQNLVPIAIADDHQMIRDWLTSTVNNCNGFKVLIKATNGKNLIEQIENSTTKPEICILDIEMPVMNGYDTAETIKKRWPNLKLLAVSIFYTPVMVSFLGIL